MCTLIFFFQGNIMIFGLSLYRLKAQNWCSLALLMQLPKLALVSLCLTSFGSACSITSTTRYGSSYASLFHTWAEMVISGHRGVKWCSLYWKVLQNLVLPVLRVVWIFYVVESFYQEFYWLNYVFSKFIIAISFLICINILENRKKNKAVLHISALFFIILWGFKLQLANNTLERVAPLTHAVGNVLKRVFVIGFSIVVFGKLLFLIFFSRINVSWFSTMRNLRSAQEVMGE